MIFRQSAAFQAEIASEVTAKTFRYFPRWQVRIAVKQGTPSSRGDGSSPRQSQAPAGGDEGGERQPAAKKPEAPKEQPTPPPLPPGYAAPQASGKVEGASGSAPEGLFVPRPSDNQAKSPQ